jgi:predicted SAM-dependent methyltransferase
MDRKIQLLDGIDQSTSVCAEIGALCNPLVDPTMPGVRFIDHLDTESLRKKYANDPHVDIEKIVNVSAVWGENTLIEALGAKVDHIVASHVIEHVPDLITWLAELRASLNDSGSIRLAIPDRRFTFDYLRQETRLADVIQAYLVRSRKPQAQFVLDFILNVASIDGNEAWSGALDAANVKRNHTASQAMDAAKMTVHQDHYHDVHCWVFTPKSFAYLMADLARSGLITLACDDFHDTEKHTIEFFVKMVPCDDVERMVESWIAMADRAVDHDAVRRQAEADKTRETISRLSSEGDELRAQVNGLNAQVDGLESQVRDLQSRLGEVLASRSWRVTAPLRAAVRVIRR